MDIHTYTPATHHLSSKAHIISADGIQIEFESGWDSNEVIDNTRYVYSTFRTHIPMNG